MPDLILPVKRIYFEQMRDGTKTHEFRLTTPYWNRRLICPLGFGRQFNQVIVTLGYPSRDDHERRIVRPWRGFEIQTITHPHFGPAPVEVFAIRVN